MHKRKYVHPSNGGYEEWGVKRIHAYGNDTETHRDGVLYCCKDGRRTAFDVKKRAKDGDDTCLPKWPRPPPAPGIAIQLPIGVLMRLRPL